MIKIDIQFIAQFLFIVVIVTNPSIFGWMLFTVLFYPEIKELIKEILAI